MQVAVITYSPAKWYPVRPFQRTCRETSTRFVWVVSIVIFRRQIGTVLKLSARFWGRSHRSKNCTFLCNLLRFVAMIGALGWAVSTRIQDSTGLCLLLRYRSLQYAKRRRNSSVSEKMDAKRGRRMCSKGLRHFRMSPKPNAIMRDAGNRSSKMAKESEGFWNLELLICDRLKMAEVCG